MQATGQKQNKAIFIEEISVGIKEPANCVRIRENLDALFGENYPLEETPAEIKRILFRHLENCRDCCRSFDARVRFRPAGRDRIY